MKKIITSITVGLLLIGGNSYSAEEQEIIKPDSELYDTSRLIEEAEYELTEDNGEKALLQDEYADKRLSEAEMAFDEGDEQKAEELMEDYNEHMQEIEENIEAAKEAGDDISKVEEIVAENSQKRFENLQALLEREDLPEAAKLGIKKALENKKMAQQRFSEALKKAEAARGNVKEKQEERTKNEETRVNAEEKQEDNIKEVEERVNAKEKQEEGMKRAEEARVNAKEKQEEGMKKAEEARANAKEKREEGMKKAEEAQENAQKINKENNTGKETSQVNAPQAQR
ncbi:hypothetical protein BKP45_07095 [Anaerobacillus alkalidiazotrophicus]|uniref:DUF5667 domain-containing protein n=1 Tax=Anaerobacillus alkalidiazotrophicus TaxID=472963 RepID=A0A1S2MFC9_9BACI|nr:DUF5667 domain-containing protein [Anaerobacillus alkalidiazotrophicus]OIJ22395.1 hypothetical protein BKP45_07095 [Anaerobacillus alkalidiazotrophicus]